MKKNKRSTAKQKRGPGRPTASDSAATREKILEVAGVLFATHGYHGTSLAQVSAEAGIAKSSLLHHFRAKGRLYRAILDRAFGDLEQSLELNPEEQRSISGFVDGFCRWIEASPLQMRMLVRAQLDNPGQAGLIVRRYWQPLLRRLAPQPPPRRSSLNWLLLAVILGNAISSFFVHFSFNRLLLDPQLQKSDQRVLKEFRAQMTEIARLLQAPAKPTKSAP
ncbi:MAG: TetR/AcrR family transcriptional regulator [Leptospirales bacterium]|nr:TetR/AcrR family transcriptional regulator [Leptospirales bacterium]